MPTVSVLMTVFNAGPFLREAVESILGQTFSDFEFIIVDDASTDGSLETLRAFAARDPRIKLIENPHKGIVGSANDGVAHCTGEFIARMDADDIASPDRLERQVAALRAEPDVVLIGGAYDLIDAAGRLLRREWPPLDDATLQEHCLRGQTPICQPLAMFRRDAFEKVGGQYDPEVETAEDNDLWLRLGEVGRMICLPNVLLKYRQHAKSASETRAEQQARGIRIGCEKAYARRGLDRKFVPVGAWRPSGPEARHEFYVRYGWWAWKFAQRRTALVYGWRAIRTRPIEAEGWKLVACGLFRPTPAPPQPPEQASHPSSPSNRPNLQIR